MALTPNYPAIAKLASHAIMVNGRPCIAFTQPADGHDKLMALSIGGEMTYLHPTMRKN